LKYIRVSSESLSANKIEPTLSKIILGEENARPFIAVAINSVITKAYIVAEKVRFFNLIPKNHVTAIKKQLTVAAIMVTIVVTYSPIDKI